MRTWDMRHDESHLISWHVGLHVEFACFIGMLTCLLLCEHGIACALRWEVALVGVILTEHGSPRCGTPF